MRFAGSVVIRSFIAASLSEGPRKSPTDSAIATAPRLRQTNPCLNQESYVCFRLIENLLPRQARALTGEAHEGRAKGPDNNLRRELGRESFEKPRFEKINARSCGRIFDRRCFWDSSGKSTLIQTKLPDRIGGRGACRQGWMRTIEAHTLAVFRACLRGTDGKPKTIAASSRRLHYRTVENVRWRRCTGSASAIGTACGNASMA